MILVQLSILYIYHDVSRVCMYVYLSIIIISFAYMYKLIKGSYHTIQACCTFEWDLGPIYLKHRFGQITLVT